MFVILYIQPPGDLLLGPIFGELRPTGGSDLAEHFDLTEQARPGMVVAIDPIHAGKLTRFPDPEQSDDLLSPGNPN